MIRPQRLSGGLLLVLILGLSSIALAQTPVGVLTPIPEKPTAPDFDLVDTMGNQHRLSDYRGKVVAVNFWASWCAPCRKEMPSMQRAYSQLKEQGVEIVAVNWGDDMVAVARFLRGLPTLGFPLLLGGDDAMISAWSVEGLPTTVIVDPQGRLAYRLVGDSEWDTPAIMEPLLALVESS